MVADWLTGQPVTRTYRPLDGISPDLPKAIIASEDARFCEHHGVDWGALREVIADSDEDGPSRGASTITMQVAKNLFLWPSRSYIRKGLEIPIALFVDFLWGKRRVMEIYVNIAQWGEGIYGAQAAAEADFKRDADKLTRRQAALIATALPNPFIRKPAHPSRHHRELSGTIMARMDDVATSCLGLGTKRPR